MAMAIISSTDMFWTWSAVRIASVFCFFGLAPGLLAGLVSDGANGFWYFVSMEASRFLCFGWKVA